MSDDVIALGPFELHSPLGRGSMGEVWRGVHVAEQVPVAIKIVTAHHARLAEARAAFDREVRAVARLRHPGVVHILDYGVIDQRGERASAGRLPAGSPGLAMELAEGPLQQPRMPWPWRRIKTLLLELLDALAHAHARGVVHRDIKPGNILLLRGPDGRAHYKLSDFGIARAVGLKEDPSNIVSGTPHYMAPEQILNRLHRQGPWTDLYSLGCLAYQVATGQSMYPGVRGASLLNCQVTLPPPRVSQAWLPSDFQAWLDHMLAKDPADRFHFAADAAFALARLAEPSVADPPVALLIAEEAATPAGLALPGVEVGSLAQLGAHAAPSDALPPLAGDATLQGEDLEEGLLLDEGEAQWATLAEVVYPQASAAAATPAAPRQVFARPACPPSWRRAQAYKAPLHLVGAGMGLFGLRPISLVDRDDERDRVWEALLAAIAARRAQMVFVQGGPGYGKTRLCEWLCHRAHELGAARVLRASHSPIASAADALNGLLMATFGTAGLSPESWPTVIGDFLGDHPLPQADDQQDARAFATLLAGTEGASAPPRMHFSSPTERHALMHRLLQRLSLTRPLILWLDDVQWGGESLAFARHLLDASLQQPLPVLILATLRQDTLGERPLETQLVLELFSRPECVTITLGPLAMVHHRHLVANILDLEPPLVEEVSQRTAGNPLFAIQLVGDWIAKDLLILGADGYCLQPGSHDDVPADIHALWLARVEQLFGRSGQGARAWRALEVAAALGQDFVPAEWTATCSALGIAMPEGLGHTLLTHRLLEQREHWLTFTHGMLRESLEKASIEHGRHPAIHAACARTLAALYGATSGALQQRLAAHLMEAKNYAEALQPLLRAAINHTKEADYLAAAMLFEQRYAALRALATPDDQPEWGETWVYEARALNIEGRLVDGAALVERAIQAAEKHGWLFIAALAQRELGFARMAQGDTQGAIDAYHQAITLLEPFSANLEHADCLLGIGRAHAFRHELDAAETHLSAAIAIQRAIDDAFGLGRSLKMVANIHQKRNQHGAAIDCLEEAQDTFEQHGYRYDVAACLNDLGETWRDNAHFDEAAQCYSRSAEIFAQLGSASVAIPRFNLGLLLLTREAYAEAEAIFRQDLVRLEPMGPSLDLAWLYAGLLPCAAAAGAWRRFDAIIPVLTQILHNSGVVDDDISFCTERAGTIATNAGQPRRARQAWSIAREQFQRLGESDAVARLDAAIAISSDKDAP